MQNESRFTADRSSISFPISILQAERLRIAAENSLGREMRRKSASLRRLLAHTAVLESLDDLQHEQLPRGSCIDHETTSTSPPSAGIQIGPAESNADDVPTLEEADDSVAIDSDDDDWSSDEDGEIDDEDDSEHGLLRMSSHVPIFLHESGAIDDHDSTRLDTLTPYQWAELASEIMGKTESGAPVTPVTASVVEVTDLEN